MSVDSMSKRVHQLLVEQQQLRAARLRTPTVNTTKDRRLAGKARIRARKNARKEAGR